MNIKELKQLLSTITGDDENLPVVVKGMSGGVDIATGFEFVFVENGKTRLEWSPDRTANEPKEAVQIL
jgi:hypothetical protein